MQKKIIGRIAAFGMTAAMAVSAVAFNASAETTLAEGTYDVKADLSCYINAMGGVEFGAPLLQSTQVVVDKDGNAEAKLSFGKSQVTIYGVTCDTFIDATGTNPGYYDAEGTLHKDAAYTLSTDTALNPQSEAVNYVDSMTFPVDTNTDTINLFVFVNSNVMGVQFCDGSGSGTTNQPDVLTKYVATLTFDWTSAEKVKTADKTSKQNANVTYTVEEGYEVEIPSEIVVDPQTKKGEYDVTAKNFVLRKDSYVTVTTNESGTLSNGTDSVAFTNELADGKLTKTGDKLGGVVTVTEDAASAGEYKGTVDFNINFFAE